MVQLKVFSGKQAGTATLARRFPFVVGRNRAADLCLEQDGIWDRHLELHLQIPDGFLRISLGLEDADDLIADFAQGLAQL